MGFGAEVALFLSRELVMRAAPEMVGWRFSVVLLGKGCAISLSESGRVGEVYKYMHIYLCGDL